MRRLLFVLPLLVPSLARAESGESLGRRVAEATVVLGAERCAGALVGETLVLTAAHCLRPGERQVNLEFAGAPAEDGSVPVTAGEIVVVDQARDMALLELSSPAPAAPLAVADAQPDPGDPVWFAGRPDRADPPQLATIERLGPCPSLPGVPDALHTSIHGRPGDSGAPLVDADGRIVGLVHGGARCSIAAPVAHFEPVIEDARGAAQHCGDGAR